MGSVSWSASMPLTHPVWSTMRGCPWFGSNRRREERSLRIKSNWLTTLPLQR